jgi:hypothetical protein
VLRFSARLDQSATRNNYRLVFNGITSAIYSSTYIYGINGTTASSRGSADVSMVNLDLNAATSTTNTFASNEIYIPNYLSTTKKVTSSVGTSEDNSTTSGLNAATAGLADITSALTSIQINPQTSNFVSGSSFYLYGISKN